MLNKISREEVIKGFVVDYNKIKESFKEILQKEGFRWSRGWERYHFYGREGVWFNPFSKFSIRIRWGINYPSAIIYVEKGFAEKIEKFFDLQKVNEGIDYPYYDYDLLNKGDIFKSIQNDKVSKVTISVLGTEVIEGDLCYLEREKKDDDTITIVLIGGIGKRVKLNKLNDFLEKSRLDKEIKDELKILVSEANKVWKCDKLEKADDRTCLIDH